MKSMMKRAIFCFVILVAIIGCASQFKQQRNLSRSLVALGMSKIQENDIQGALSELHKARTANPTDPEVYYGFAFAYWRSGKYDQAIENADKAVEYADKLEVEHPGLKGEAYNLKGNILSSQGKYNEAIENFKKALTDELYQTPEYALHNLASLYLEKKNIRLAFETTQKTLDRNSHYAPAWHLLSKIYVAQGKPDDAVDALKHAILEYPAYAEAHWDLGQLYLQMRAPQKAREELTKVVEIDPGGYYGTMAVEKLKEMQ
jgi:type IV pilus assembly protein PilF